MQRLWVYLVRRALHSLLVLLVLSFVVSLFLRCVPGDPVRMSLGGNVSEEVIAQMRHELYLDRSVFVQYSHWIKNVLLHGDFGESLYTHRRVSQDIAMFLPRSLELVFWCALLILVVGVTLGTVAALFRDTSLDVIMRVVAYLGVVTPPYAFAVLFMLLFAFQWAILPLGGLPSVPEGFRITGMLGVDAILRSRWDIFGATLRHLVLPVISLSLGGISSLVRLHRSALIDNIPKDYIAFARVVGVREFSVVAKHLMKPSFVPTLTLLALQISALLGNAFLIELIFRYPGFSRYSLEVIMAKDPYAIVAVTLIFGVIFALANLLIDLGVAWLDPRVRLRTSD